jgi:hypothetical protein
MIAILLLLLAGLADQPESSSVPAQPASSSALAQISAAPLWIQLPAGVSSGAAVLSVGCAEKEVKWNGSLPAKLADTGQNDSPAILFTPRGQAKSGEARVFFFLADVTQIPPQAFTQSRTGAFAAGNCKKTISYVITNRIPVREKTLNVKFPETWSVKSRNLPVLISTQGAPATGLTVHATFVEASNRSTLPPKAVQLCNEQGLAPYNINIPANSTQVAYLCYLGPDEPGTYNGTIRLSALEYDAKDQQLAIYVTSCARLLWGVIFVCLGTFLAWWVKSYTSNRVTRDQALLPITVFRERLVSLDSDLKTISVQLGTNTPRLSKAVSAWIEQMDSNRLEAAYNLPSKTPSPFVVIPSISGEYTAFLSKADTAITLLTVFVKEGVDKVADLVNSGRIPAPNAPRAIAMIDDGYDPSLSATAAAQLVSRHITSAIPQEGLMALAASGAAMTAQPSFTHLLAEIRWLNTAAWLALLALAAIGTVIAVVLKPDFGKVSDYLLCLVSSFGIPVVGGTAIPSRTTGTVLTTAGQATSGSRGLSGV